MSPSPTELRGPRRLAAYKAGFKIHLDYNLVITGPAFAALSKEGWHLYIDEEGVLIGYIPPNIRERLEAL